MSVRLMSWAFHEAPTTRKGDLLVLLVLADHAHDDGAAPTRASERSPISHG